jgi:UDP-N-acetylglucosamine 2-epimerase
MLAGAEPQKILSAAKAMAGRQGWENPFGDGAASRQILDAII